MLEILFWAIFSTLMIFYLGYYGLMIYYAQKSSNTTKKRIHPKVSLVIPTYNEETTILQKLKNVETLDYPKDKLQIIVIDSGSTDNTREIVNNYIHENKGKLKIQLLTQEKRLGKAQALNHVWQFCNGEIVIISDADSLLEKDAVTQIVANFADPKVGATTGKLVFPNLDQSSTTRMEGSYRSFYEVLRLGESRMDSTPIFNGPLSAFRQELLQEIDENTVADDTELAIRIRKQGYLAIYDPEAIVYEYAPPTQRARFKLKQRRGQGIIQSFIRHSDAIFKSRYGKYGSFILPCEFFMHIISPVLMILLIISFILMTMNNPAMPALSMLLSPLIIITAGVIIMSRTLLSRRKFSLPLLVPITFLQSQICLLLGLLAMIAGKTSHVWRKIEDVRTL